MRARQADVGVREFIVGINAANFAALPSAAANTGKLALVLASSGTWLVNYKSQGIYYSDGSTWSYKGDYEANDQASEIQNTPAGNISATDVQAAINELDSEKATLTAAQTFTGAQEFNNVTITKTAPAISSGVITYALAGSNVFSVALNANITTSTVTGVGATGKTSSFQVMFTADGTVRSIVHPSGIVWAAGAAPTMTGTNNKRDWIQYITHDGGTVWFGFVLGQNF